MRITIGYSINQYLMHNINKYPSITEICHGNSSSQNIYDKLRVTLFFKRNKNISYINNIISKAKSYNGN